MQLKAIDWNILFLSSNLKNKEDAYKVNNNILKLNKCLTTTAQLFKRKNLEKIINIIENSDIEIDNTYDMFLENKYCLYPMCVYQRMSYSDINNKIIDYGHFHKKFIY
jgi:DNA polymerase III gamma/tau subunit